MLANQLTQLQSLLLLAQDVEPSSTSVLGGHLLAVVIFSAIGIVVFVAGLFLIELLTPFSVKHEIIEEHNTALAIVLGAIIIGMSLIIAASVLG